MTDKEAIKQLASLIINSQLFHQDEGDLGKGHRGVENSDKGSRKSTRL